MNRRRARSFRHRTASCRTRTSIAFPHPFRSLFRPLGFSRRQNHVGSEPDLISHPIPLDRRLRLSADRRPLFHPHPFQHRPEWSCHCARVFENFFRVSRPGPWQILSGLLYLVKCGDVQQFRKRACSRESKRIGPSRWKHGTAHMPVHNLHRALPIRLFHRAPGGEAGSSSGLQHAVQFRQRSLGIAEKHHPKAASGKIKGLISKRQVVRVGLPGREV